tara:strand:- start:239 stop:1390 length:1152 start_codon:yes stop_codon:yes gene_type:complete
MDNEYLSNPLNKRKKKYKYYLRKFEDFIKLLVIYIIVLPFIMPFLFFNYLITSNYYFKDFTNQNGVVFFIFTLKEMYRCKFIIRLSDFGSVLSRFGLLFFIKNFSFNFGFKKYKSISFKNKNSDLFLNTDYFKFFEENDEECSNKFILPFYLPKNYYLKKRIYDKFKKNEKKFKIIFSGTVHSEWYGNLDFTNKKKEKFLNRVEIIDTLIENFNDKVITIKNQSELHQLNDTDKEIVVLETDPDMSLREKNFSLEQHLEFISKSNFFLCMPGTSMPLSYHLVESCLVGTVPILSYNDFIFPSFKKNEAMFFFDKLELVETISKALKILPSEYYEMQKNITNYYKKNLSTYGVAQKILKKNFPLELFINLDHTSTKKREARMIK